MFCHSPLRFSIALLLFFCLATKAFSQATEPSTNPSNLQFFNLRTYACDVVFNHCDADGFIVLQSENNTPVEPTDGTVYDRGDEINDAHVVYVGADTVCTITGAMASKTFYFNVYAFNGASSDINYRQTGALVGNLSMPASMKENYYDGIDTANALFVMQLKQRVRSPYTQQAYANYDETMVADFAASNAAGGLKNLVCVYSGQQFTYAPPFAWTPATPFSREHTWCHSWMPTYPSTSAAPYTDYHHLFPTNQNDANGVRSNHPLGDVINTTSSYLEGKLGYNAVGQIVYEPRDAQKGDAARTLMYMALRYDGVDNQSWTFNWLNDTLLPSISETKQNVELLLQWHAQDPPDFFEISRNDYIQHLQQNRNPFVDHTAYASLIDFNTMQYKQTLYATQSAATKAFEATVFPVPSNGEMNVQTNCGDGALMVRWIDVRGRAVKIWESPACATAATDASELPAGLYLLLLNSCGAQTMARWVKE